MTTLPPLCRCCGKPIPKRTRVLNFGQQSVRHDDYTVSMTEKPRTREEAERLINEQIISIKWSDDYQTHERNGGERYIERVGIWDGVSYVDEFFVNGKHQARFAYAVARQGTVLKAYNDAIRARAAKMASEAT